MFTNENGRSLDDRLHYHIAQAGPRNIGEMVWEGGEIARMKQGKRESDVLHEDVTVAARSASARDQPIIFRHSSHHCRWRHEGGGRHASRRTRRGEGEGINSAKHTLSLRTARRGVGACARGNGGSGTPSVNVWSFSVDGCWSANTTVCMYDCVCIMSGRQADGQAGIGEDALR